VLGPLEVVEDGRSIRLDRQRLRTLLAFLLLHANEVVSTDRLIDEVWGPDPPKTAGASLQNYISRLRKAIGAELILSQPPGYLLRVDPEHFDLARFERLIAEARGGSLRDRSEKLRAALALWRGAALEDLAYEPSLREEVGRLEEARLAAVEERIDAELALGTGDDLVRELEELIEEQPLRERPRGLLMRALYRAGRQADALAAYQDARRVLLDELGLEPGEELRALQQSILKQDPSLGTSDETAVERAPDRRTVTVLFCDLLDSTYLATKLDPEVYRRLMSRYFEVVSEPIRRHGGTLEKFIGDAVMAVFGVPDLHEDDALRATRAAVEAQAALGDEDWDVPLAARIGLTTGEVHVLSAPGGDLHVSGAATSLAAQLEQGAPAGGVLLSDETYRLVRDAVRAEPVDGAWRLEGLVADAPAYARRLDAPLVGREHELQRLQAAFENAREEGHCRVVTVVGEAGIGKTRLARELLTSARDEASVLVGRCVSYGEGATYLPVVEIVRQACPELSLAGIESLLEREDDAEVVAQRIAELTGITAAPAAPGEAFWAVRRMLEALARERPLLVVFDDLHWAEPTLLDLVEYLGEWASAQILVLCLARPDLLESRTGWGGPTSTGFLVELEPLAADDVEELLVQLAAEPVDPELERRIVEQSGGNPLFAEQLLALAAEAPDLALEKPPATVEALLASRLDRLDPRELGVLRRAAVVGRRFSRAELDDLTPDEDPMRHLHALAERGLVHPVDDLFRFHHVLVREVAYRGIPKSERSELHELAGRSLDRREGADELVGYHFEQAYRYSTELGKPDERARDLAMAGGERLRSAGIRAWKRADAPAAVNLLTRAVDLLPEGNASRRELLCELGVACRACGETERADKHLAEAVANSLAHRDRRVELRARIELANMRTFGDAAAVGDLLELASDAIPTFETFADDRSLGRAWLFVGYARGNFLCDNSALEDAAAKAAYHYTRAGWSPSTSLSALGSALFYGPRPVEDAVEHCERLLRDHAGDRASEANIHVWLGGLEGMRGRHDEGLALVDSAESVYRELGQALAAGDICGLVRAAIHTLADETEAAERALRLACETCIRLNELALLASRAAELADTLYRLSSYEESEHWMAVSRARAGREDRDAQSSWRSIAALLAARKGDRAVAERLSREALEIVETTDAVNHHAKVLLDLAEVLRPAERESEASNRVKEAVDLYELKGNTVAAARARHLIGHSSVA
jgi:DNA-binding SARP family transcriptional activator/predicted ATPase